MQVFDDIQPRYVPEKIVCNGRMVPVARTIAHPTGAHPEGCPLIKDCIALELQTERGSRWFGCKQAFIDGSLRMVAIGCNTKDSARMAWKPVNESIELDDFTRAFLECALWSSNDESRPDGGDPLDDRFTIDDIDTTCVRKLAAECARFQEENAQALESSYGYVEPGWSNDTVCCPSRAGHDFWLTRNGHGSGFWDGDWPEPHATTLTAASKTYGSVDLYVGDDGKVYAIGYGN